jgi:hypothetical protein
MTIDAVHHPLGFVARFLDQILHRGRVQRTEKERYSMAVLISLQGTLISHKHRCLRVAAAHPSYEVAQRITLKQAPPLHSLVLLVLYIGEQNHSTRSDAASHSPMRFLPSTYQCPHIVLLYGLITFDLPHNNSHTTCELWDKLV